MSRKLKIAFIPTSNAGVNFYRVWQPAESLRAMGHKVAVLWYSNSNLTMHPWEWDIASQDLGDRLLSDIDMSCAWADVVVWMCVHSANSLKIFTDMKIKYGKPFLTETDDFVFSVNQGSGVADVWKHGSQLIQVASDQISLSDGVICSTPYLSDILKSFNKKTHIVENHINPKLWKKPKKSDKVTIGWMGGYTHNEDLEMVAEPIAEVLNQNKKCQFSFVSGGPKPKFFEGFPRLKWKNDFKPINLYPKWMSKFGFDIGIAPLEDNHFNRAKSNLRWLEFSAMGIPTVASPLPHFKQSIEERKTGFLASSNDEWVEKLGWLINDSDLRTIVGKAARQEVKDKWNPKKTAMRYLDVFNDVLGGEYAQSNEGDAGDEDRGLDRRPEQHQMVGI